MISYFDENRHRIRYSGRDPRIRGLAVGVLTLLTRRYPDFVSIDTDHPDCIVISVGYLVGDGSSMRCEMRKVRNDVFVELWPRHKGLLVTLATPGME